FAKAYTRRLGDEELASATADDLFEQVTSVFAFADGRGNRPIAVRLFDPAQASSRTEGIGAGTVIETNTDDSPFLVDSVAEELAARSLEVRRLLHPVIGTVRDQEGRIARVLPARDADHRESVMHIEIERTLSAGEREHLER